MLRLISIRDRIRKIQHEVLLACFVLGVGQTPADSYGRFVERLCSRSNDIGNLDFDG